MNQQLQLQMKGQIWPCRCMGPPSAGALLSQARTLSLMPRRTLSRDTSSSCVALKALPSRAHHSSITRSGRCTSSHWYSSTPGGEGEGEVGGRMTKQPVALG